MNASTFLMVCLLALVPFILATPDPTDPNVRVKVTPRGMEFLSKLATQQFKKFFGNRELFIDLWTTFSVDQSDRHAHYTVLPQIKLTTIANDAPVPSYDDFLWMHMDGTIEEFHRDNRNYRRNVTVSKVVYEDTEFLAGKQLGAIQAEARGVEFHATSSDAEDYSAIISEGHIKATAYFGQKDGFLKLARLAIETDGVMTVKVAGRTLNNEILSDERHREKHFEAMDRFMEPLRMMSRKVFQVLGSQFLDHVVMDTRLTEHPLFTEEGFELNMVGSLVYDEADQYTKNSCAIYDMVMMEMKKMRREGEEPTMGGDSYTQDFVVWDESTTSKTNALALEGSDSAENERRARACFVISVRQEMWNSIYRVVQKSHLFDLSFDRVQIGHMFSMYNNYGNHSNAKKFDINALPAGTHFTFRIEPITDGGELLEVYEGGVRERYVMTVGFNGMLARYTFFTDVKITFRNGKFAFDVLKLTVHKEADQDYPRIFTEESLKFMIEDYLIRHDNGIFGPEYIRHLTQFDLHDGTMTLGIDILRGGNRSRK